MTEQQAQQIVAQYQAALDRQAAELRVLRQLRQVVVRHLEHKASFAELRQAAKESEVRQ